MEFFFCLFILSPTWFSALYPANTAFLTVPHTQWVVGPFTWTYTAGLKLLQQRNLEYRALWSPEARTTRNPPLPREQLNTPLASPAFPSSKQHFYSMAGRSSTKLSLSFQTTSYPLLPCLVLRLSQLFWFGCWQQAKELRFWIYSVFCHLVAIWSQCYPKKCTNTQTYAVNLYNGVTG